MNVEDAQPKIDAIAGLYQLLFAGDPIPGSRRFG